MQLQENTIMIERALVGSTPDLKGRLQKNGSYLPVVAITGFHANKEIASFESNVKDLSQKKEFSEYASLYKGRCPENVVRRILAIRCLLCENESCWSTVKGKRRRYVLHWGTYMDIDTKQLEVLQNCPWARIGRVVKHVRMALGNENAIRNKKSKKNDDEGTPRSSRSSRSSVSFSSASLER
nr:3392_t:CDS:2 [Entrophospora candida]